MISIQSVRNSVLVSARSLVTPKSAQIPALDGLRALAIIMVIASHSKNDFIFAGGSAVPAFFFSAAGSLSSGVDLFFVLSGFLIGSLLLKELKKTGSIQIFSFLMRRGLRIWPLYYFVCGLSFLRYMAAGNGLAWKQIWPDLFFLTDYYPEKLAFGTWSLSIEEQFYLLGSIVSFVISKSKGRISFKMTAFTLSTFLISPLIRFVTWKQNFKAPFSAFYVEWDIIHNFLHTHYDGLALGVLIACIFVFSSNELKSGSLTGRILSITTLLFGILSFFFPIYFYYTFLSLLFGSLVWHALASPDSRFNRVLSWPGFRMISRLSYGMYLWYRFPLWRIAQWVMSKTSDATPLFQYFLIFTTAFLVALVTAFVSYTLVELPFLNLRTLIHVKGKRRGINVKKWSQISV